MSDHSTARRVRRKRADRPAQPYPEFPLQAHGLGHWSKRVRGRLCYFGRWGQRENGKLIALADGGNWQAALTKYRLEINDLQAGRLPLARTHDPAGLRLNDLFNRFLTSKTRRVRAGELSPRTFREYREATDLMIKVFGNRLVDDLRPDDFEELRAGMTKSWGPSRVSKFVQLVRSVFKFGRELGLIEKSVLYGPEFNKPSKAVMRRQRLVATRNSSRPWNFARSLRRSTVRN